MALHALPLVPQSFQYVHSIAKPSPELPEFFHGTESITQDAQGFLWIASEQGVIRWDGHTSLLFSFDLQGPRHIPLKAPQRIYADSQGRIWVGSFASGALAIDAATLDITAYANIPGDSTSLSANRIDGFFEDASGHLWIQAHGEGFNRLGLDGQAFTRLKPSAYFPDIHPRNGNIISGVIADPKNRDAIWATSADGLYWLNTRTLELRRFAVTQATMTNPQAYNGAENNMRCLIADESDNLWIGSWFCGLHRFHIPTQTWTNYRFNKGSTIDGHIHNISGICWRNGLLWLAGQDNGLLAFDPQTGTFKRLHASATMLEDVISPKRFFEDREGRLWVGSAHHRLQCLPPPTPSLHRVEVPGGLHMALYDAAHGEILGMSQQGPLRIHVFDTGFGRLRSSVVRQDETVSKAIDFSRDGRLLVLTEQRLWVSAWPYQRFEEIPMPEIDRLQAYYDGFEEMQVDANNHLWIACRGYGLLQLDLGTMELRQHGPETFDEAIRPYWIFQIAEDDQGKLWFAGDGGLGVYEPDTRKWTQYDQSNSTIDVTVASGIAFSGGKTYAASPGSGFVELDVRGDTLHGRVIANHKQLQASEIYQLHGIGKGRVILSTSEGLKRYDPAAGFVHVLYEHGLDWYRKFRPGPGKLDLAGSHYGLSALPVDFAFALPSPPRALITSLAVMDSARSLSSDLSFSPDENLIAVEFTALEFQYPKQLQYQYRLQGAGNDWADPRGRSYVSFAHLDPGDYAFEVRARLGDGPWGETDQLVFRIRPAFWQTWWFRGGMVLLVLALVATLYALQVRRIRQREQLKSEFEQRLQEVKMTALRAQMNPHFLFNCLNSIKLFILKNDADKASDYLTKFSRLIRLILENSRHDKVMLGDELDALKLYVQMEAMRFDNKFAFHLDIQEGLDIATLQIPPLLLQPYVENAIWHGLMHKDGPGAVRLRLQSIQGHLHCEIEDDGIGREASRRRKATQTASKSYGMTITQERLNVTHGHEGVGRVEIIDLKDEQGQGQGTLVKLWLK